MSILLTPPRGLRVDKPHLVDFGGPLRPPLGGPVQTLHRLGTRFALDVTLSPLRTEPYGRQFAAALMQAKLVGARILFGQDRLAIGSPGSPVVNGALQSGTTLNLRGFTAAYVVHQGQFFSMVHGGRRYLHFAASDTTADGSGVMALPIFPMLRVLTADADVCEFATPSIEGSLSGNEVAWQRLTSPFSDFGSFTITEDE